MVSTLGLVELAFEDLESGDLAELKTNLDRIKTSMTRLTHLVTDILELSKAEVADNPPESVNLNALITEVFEETEQTQSCPVELKCDCEGLQQDISLQRTRLKQILRNMVENSIKYASPARREAQKAYCCVSVSQQAHGIRIIVQDNGLGIPAQCHDKVFSMFARFHSDEADGSGLGMAIVKKHVIAMNGSISFSSSEAGTTFEILIPITVEKAA
jgi:signal transduction histidine kinase